MNDTTQTTTRPTHAPVCCPKCRAMLRPVFVVSTGYVDESGAFVPTERRVSWTYPKHGKRGMRCDRSNNEVQE